LANDRPLLLVVDDDPVIAETLSYALSGDFEVLSSPTRPHCLGLLRQLRQMPQLALIDLGLPPLPHRPEEGFALIGDLLAHAPDLKIVVLSGQNDDDNARHARALGAVDFIAKPCEPAALLAVLHKALHFALPAGAGHPVAQMIGDSQPMQRLRMQLSQYANLAFPVLIEGESGSGKDIVASLCLHQQTRRRDHPFLALNCAAISPNLLEPTLFGYAKGAFTGAHAARSGYFEDADEGTLFLDEIGELPLELQPKLLRVLENGEYQRVGETQPRLSRARIVAATNRDLRQEVRAGRFRADLYHRLSVFTLNVPPLRDMGNDRLLLLEHFRRLYATQTHTQPFQLTREAEARWLTYRFPGNARELRNIVIRLTARYPGQMVDTSTLIGEFDLADDPPENVTESASDLTQATAIAKRHLQDNRQISLDNTLGTWERGYIEAALELSGGNISQAAKRLGINRTTLYNRMEGWHRQ